MLLYKTYRYFIKRIPKVSAEYFYVLDIEKEILSDDSNTEVHLLTLDNLKLLPNVFHKTFRGRLSSTSDQGYFIAINKDEYAFLWVATKDVIKIKEIGKAAKIQHDEAWIYHVYTSEKFRNKGASSSLVREVIKKLSYTAQKRVICYTDKYNQGMQSVLNKNGFKLYKVYNVLSLFGKSISYRCKSIVN